jgi:L,D-peptidoglycan transpeptidase YkuD (ErfK/YbiS/YcfS/YnhG family)
MRMAARLPALLALSLVAWCASAVVLPPRLASAATPPGQIVTVQSTSAAATTARLDLWQLDARGVYNRVWGPAIAHVGELGIGVAHEGVPRTPAGMFGLTQAFGNTPNNGTRLPYFQAGPYDWWNGESGSPAYNTHVHQVRSPGPASENLYYAGGVYAHAVVINYNRFPVRAGAGSAFFFHVTNGQPTAGCVAIGSAQLDQVMRWLNPAAHPVMSIGVGAQATAYISKVNAAAPSHNPKGYLDSVTPAGHGNVRVQGWAADPDNLSAQLNIAVYAGSQRVAAIRTGVPRPDVATAIHAGPNQGFDAIVAIAPGSYTVCTLFYNIGFGTGNTARCRPVVVS